MPMKVGQKQNRVDGERFFKLAMIFSKTIRQGNCFIYQGRLKPKKDRPHFAYPEISYRRKLYRGNRLVYELIHGPFPSDKIICHTCDNPACVSPAHLYLGTSKDNNRDVMDRKRHATAFTTQCQRGHDFDKDNTMLKRGANGNIHRTCRICYKESNRIANVNYRARKLAKLERLIGGE